MTTSNLRSDLAEARQLIAQAEEILGPALEAIELAGGTTTGRDARRLNTLVSDAHDALAELEASI